MAIESRVIYTDIESMLDVRQAVMGIVCGDQQLVYEILQSVEYCCRKEDTIMLVSKENYRKLIATGNPDILQMASPTYVAGLIANEIGACTQKYNAQSQPVDVELWVNIHPFILDEEGQDYLMKTIFTKYGSNVPVKIVDFPNKDLTPEIIHNYGIEAVFMYDYKPWLDANGKNIVQNPPRDTRFLLAPLLQVTPTEQDLEDNKEIGIENMVKFFEMAIMPVLNVNHLPIPYYTNAFISKPMVDKQLAQLEEIRKAEAASIKIPEEVLDEWLGDQV